MRLNGSHAARIRSEAGAGRTLRDPALHADTRAPHAAGGSGDAGITRQQQPTAEPRDARKRAVAATTSHAAASRRSVLLAGAAAPVAAVLPPPNARALTLADVTPRVAPAGPLPAREQALVDAYEAATYSVVNIIDVNLGVGGQPG